MFSTARIEFSPNLAPGGASRDKNKSLFLLYLECKSVHCVSDKGAAEPDGENTAPAINAAGDVQQFSARDLEGIREIAATPRLFRALVHSFCPAIFGHETVKAGLLLAIFGGVQKNIGERQKLLTRGDPHVLVVGDPGLYAAEFFDCYIIFSPSLASRFSHHVHSFLISRTVSRQWQVTDAARRVHGCAARSVRVRHVVDQQRPHCVHGARRWRRRLCARGGRARAGRSGRVLHRRV